MKADVSRDLSALFYINRMTFKNYIRQIFENPFKTVMTVLKWVFYFVLILSPMLIQLMKNKTRSVSPVKAGLVSAEPYISGGLLLILLLYVFYNLKKAIDDYKPAIFRPADANLVFSSPLNRHTIYFFALVRSMFRKLMTAVMFVCIFFIVTLSLRISLIGWAVPLAVIGLFSFGVFMQSFKFFINSLNKKLKSDKLTTFVFYAFLAAVICVILYSVFKANRDLPSMIAALGSPSLEYIPFAGWAKGLVMGLIYTNPRMVPLTVLYVLCAVASVMLSVAWADDYYEDAITNIGETGEIQESVKKGHTDEILARSYRGKKQAKTTVSVKGTGASAYLWKSLLIYKKGFISRPVSNSAGYLLLLLVGIAFAVFFKPGDSLETIVFLLTIAFFASTMTGSVANPLVSELKHSYVFMTPGKTRRKLFFIVFQPILQLFIQSLLLFAPMLAAGKLAPADFICSYIAAVTIGALPISGGVIVTAVFPDDEALRKNPLMAMLKGLFMFVYFLPGGIICAVSLLLVWFTTHTAPLTVGLLSFAAGNAIAVFLIFFISEKIFARLEYNQ